MRRGGRQLSPEIAKALQEFARYKPGQSFFVADAVPEDLEYLRRPAVTRGIGIQIRRTECDEIYQQPGVRVFRKEGAYDEF